MRAFLSLFVMAAVSRSAVAVIDFSFYPQLAQPCLYQASNSSKCDSATVSATNKCLCTNGGSFITNAAKCLGREDPADVSLVYRTMSTACTDSKTPISITQDEFLKAAAVPSSTTARPSDTAAVTRTVTATAPAATDNKDKDEEETNKGLSTGAMAGIIGGVVGVVAILGASVFFFFWRRKRRDGEESHPMLPQHGVGMHALPTHSAQAGMPSPGMAYQAGAGGEWPDDRKWRPSPNPSDHRSSAGGFNWETPYDAYAAPKYPTPTPPPPPPPPAAYELVGSDHHIPAQTPGSPPIMEMEGTPVPQPQDRFQPYRAS